MVINVIMTEIDHNVSRCGKSEEMNVQIFDRSIYERVLLKSSKVQF